MAGGGGGAWKVAYADFVTAMMAFFMVMWLTSQKPEVKEALAEYFSDPWAKYKINHNKVRKPTLTEPKAGENPPKKKFMGSHPTSVPHDEAEWPTSGKPKIVTVRASERTTVGATVQFMAGVDELTPESKLRLEKLAPQLKGMDNKIEIRGHTSTQAASLEAELKDLAWRLCYQRCLQVMQFLEGQGIAPDRMRPSLAGPFEPITLDPSDEEQEKNARVEVFLLAETAESFKGNKAQRAKAEQLDEHEAKAWLEEHDPQTAAEAKPKGGH